MKVRIEQERKDLNFAIYDMLKNFIGDNLNLKEYIIRDDEGSPLAFDGTKLEDELSDLIHDGIYTIRTEYENYFDDYED